MAAKKQSEEINLLPQKHLQTSTAGRILAWILSTFRVIVIVTEIIVMVAFLSRFWFDAQNSDLNEKIIQKQYVLSAAQDFESKFKDVQKRLAIYSDLVSNNVANTSVLELIKNSLPQDVIIVKIISDEGRLEVTASTPNERSIQQFIVNLSASQLVSEVGLTEANTATDNPTNLIFTITALIQKGKGV